MKKLIFGLIGIVVALYVLFVLLKPVAIAPNGELSNPTPTAQAQIIVDQPKPGQRVSDPIIVTGKAIAFESTISWRLRDGTGKEIAKGNTMTSAPDVGVYGNFLIRIPVPANPTENLTIEVYESSAKDGSEIHKVSVPVVTY